MRPAPPEAQGPIRDNPVEIAVERIAARLPAMSQDARRELIGAFPSLVLAEGEYVAIARHDAKTFQTTFKVSSTLDRDVEVLAK